MSSQPPRLVDTQFDPEAKLKKLRQLSAAIVALKHKRDNEKFSYKLGVSLQLLERSRRELRATIPPFAI